MKKVLSIAFVLVLVLATASAAFAQLGDTDNSSFSIQNLGTADATVTVTFYAEDGTAYTPTVLNLGQPNPFTLAPGAGWEIYVPAIPAAELPDGRYSVVIESTEPVAVIANLIGDTVSYDFNGSYSGFEAGADTIYLPSIFYNYYGWYSMVSVQNVGPDPVDVEVDYYQGDVLIAKHTAAGVPGFSSVHFDWETDLPTVEPGQALPDPNEAPLSAVVLATGNVVAVDNQTVPAAGYMQSYNGFLAGATTRYAPSLFSSYYGWFSSLLIQNVGAADTEVTVTYNDGVTADVFTLAPKQANQLLYRGDLTPGHGTEVAFAATITTDGEPVVAIVNQASWPGAPTFPHSDQAQTYNTFAAGYLTWGLPTIFQKYYNWDTSFSFQNVGGGPTDVTVIYSENLNPAGAPYAGCTFTVTGLAAGASVEFYQPNHHITPPAGCAALPNDYQGNVTLASTAEPIVAQVNETNDVEKVNSAGDWSMSYNGFGQ